MLNLRLKFLSPTTLIFFILFNIIECNSAAAKEDSEISHIMGELYDQTVYGIKNGTSIVSEELLSKFIKRLYKVNKISDKGAEKAVRKAMHSLEKSSIKSLSANIIVGLIIDTIADVVMEDILDQSIPEVVRVPLAATAYVTIKSSYVFYSSNGNLSAIAAGQSMLLLEIANKDIEAIQELSKAKDIAAYADLRRQMWSIYADYTKKLSTSNETSKSKVVEDFKTELANIGRRNGLSNSLFLGNSISPSATTSGAGSLNTGDVRSDTTKLYDALALDFIMRLLNAEVARPTLELRYTEYVPAPAQTRTFFTPTSLSGKTDVVPLETFYAAAPDLTTDTQNKLVADANPNTPVDPPVIAAAWAGRMSLSGTESDPMSYVANMTVTTEAMQASGNAPINNFILFNPSSGVLSTPIHGTQAVEAGVHSFNHLIWGDWTGGNRTWTSNGITYGDLYGNFVYGQLTPTTARTTGSATYTGILRGDVAQSLFPYGDFGLTANFRTGALDGWLAISGDESNNYVFVSGLANATIERQNGRLHFSSDLDSEMANGYLEGYFYGPNGTELGGTYQVIADTGYAQGVLLGWETGSMPTKPAFADGSKRAHISTQMSDGYVLDSSLSIITVPVQGQPSVALAVPQEQGGGTVSTSQVYAKNGYSYTSWGKWTANDTTPDTYSSGGYWAAGDATPSSVMQNKTGSAVYDGEIIGDHVSNGVRQAAQGSVHLTADFNADQISGNVEFHTATTSMMPAPIDAPIEGDGSFRQISSDVANGNFGYGIQGNFFGPNADEVGGSAWASTSEGTYNGVFRAKQ